MGGIGHNSAVLGLYCKGLSHFRVCVAKVCHIFQKPCFGVLIVVFSAAVLGGAKKFGAAVSAKLSGRSKRKKAPRILERGACEI